MALSALCPQRNEIRTRHSAPFSVVVAIDFGTTSSGYAFSFVSDPEAIHMMRYLQGWRQPRGAEVLPTPHTPWPHLLRV